MTHINRPHMSANIDQFEDADFEGIHRRSSKKIYTTAHQTSYPHQKIPGECHGRNKRPAWPFRTRASGNAAGTAALARMGIGARKWGISRQNRLRNCGKSHDSNHRTNSQWSKIYSTKRTGRQLRKTFHAREGELVVLLRQ